MITRKGFLKLAVAGGASAYLATQGGFARVGRAAQSTQIPLNPKTIPQFVDPLPDLLGNDSLIIDNGSQIQLVMQEQLAFVLSTGTLPNYAGTRVWSYLIPGQNSRTSYLGPVILATRGVPTEIKFTNNLGYATDAPDAYKYSTDLTLHWADPDENMFSEYAGYPEKDDPRAQNYSGSIPAVPHLHGGYVPPVLDGGPDAWFTSDGLKQGSSYYTYPLKPVLPNECIYRYPNDQEGALIWFHDHTLGATRLNVFMGLAGAHLIVDPADTIFGSLPTPVPLVIQDRMFDDTGQLFFPSDTAGGILWALNPEHPYWVPEFIGDTIVVNGKTWPFMSVEQKRYTFFIINGSNARTYEMFLIDPISKNFGPPLWVIGTDGGYLDLPAKVDPAAVANNRLVMMPGERYWVIVDFNGYGPGVIGPNGAAFSGKWLLRNSAKAPYPGGESPQGSTTARIMQFVVAQGAVEDESYNPASGAPLRTEMTRLSSAMATNTRQLTLNEVELPPKTAIDPVTGATTKYPGGPTEVLVNNTKWNGKRITGIDDMGMFTKEPIPGFTLDLKGINYLSEIPNEGETEIWEIINTTMDAHPIHTHLAQFQLLSRQNYDAKKYFAAYSAAFAGGFDFTTGLPALPGVYIPAWGPPLDYSTVVAGKIGGNPDVTPFLKGAAMGPLPQENGWKDTVIVPPGMVTRFIIRWAPQELAADTPPEDAALNFDPAIEQGGYVWHCHIVDHEDNEMMRPDQINPLPIPNLNRVYKQGVDY